MALVDEDIELAALAAEMGLGPPSPTSTASVPLVTPSKPSQTKTVPKSASQNGLFSKIGQLPLKKVTVKANVIDFTSQVMFQILLLVYGDGD